MSRHTKIVATLGPSSTDPAVLERMVNAGVDVVRLNFSHGKAEDHIARVETIRQVSARTGRPVGILADLQGPKIRIGKFAEGKVTLTRGEPFVLDACCEIGDCKRAGLDYKDLPRDVKSGDILLLDDGRLRLEVERVLGHEIHTRVQVGGELSNNKGINRLGGGLSAPALTA
ncbi:MAG: pyruvate kinase, partial [Zoogloea sp.]|nr:pyruvate kinase [Zoogloea sp.]